MNNSINADEALRCLDIAKLAVKLKDFDKA